MSTDGLFALSKAGVSEPVINAMMERQRAGGAPSGARSPRREPKGFEQAQEESERGAHPGLLNEQSPCNGKHCRGSTNQSGRPDLNRGPPAPKAGAIPGYATPRGVRKLLYPALSAQRG
jgi:hypothetical protein